MDERRAGGGLRLQRGGLPRNERGAGCVSGLAISRAVPGAGRVAAAVRPHRQGAAGALRERARRVALFRVVDGVVLSGHVAADRVLVSGVSMGGHPAAAAAADARRAGVAPDHLSGGGGLWQLLDPPMAAHAVDVPPGALLASSVDGAVRSGGHRRAPRRSGRAGYTHHRRTGAAVVAPVHHLGVADDTTVRGDRYPQRL
eukprot:ctg_901.g206